MKYVPKELPEGINAPRTNVLAEMALLAGALVAVAVGLFWVLGLAAERLAVRTSPELEAAIGERFPLADVGRPVSGREREVLDALLAHTPYEPARFELRVVCGADDANAFAVPGGRLVVLDPLLDAVRSENELAFVLAHELGHFHHRDHLRALGRGLVLVAVLTAVGTGGDFAASLVARSAVAVSHRFSQRQELAADRYAAELVQRAYGHAGGLTDFLSHPALDDAGGWFGTHPASRQRVEALERLARERGWQAGAVTPYRRSPALCPD
ncbi:MAG TPA: M48 family metallopeptidase [Candidatus Limnocylindria bacterium]|nr:M48 family metallopeptidase [Candidatus Limnocylindria bacterium]